MEQATPQRGQFDLTDTTKGVYLHHRSGLGEFWLSSDSVMQTFITRHVCARIDAPRFCSLTLIAELATQGAPTRAIRRPFLRTTADPLKMMYRFPDGALHHGRCRGIVAAYTPTTL